MAMAITMRMVARIFFFATEVTQGPLSSVHYTHIKRSPKSRCAICSGFEDTAKMSPRSRGTCPPDLAGDPLYMLKELVSGAWQGSQTGRSCLMISVKKMPIMIGICISPPAATFTRWAGFRHRSTQTQIGSGAS